MRPQKKMSDLPLWLTPERSGKKTRLFSRRKGKNSVSYQTYYK